MCRDTSKRLGVAWLKKAILFIMFLSIFSRINYSVNAVIFFHLFYKSKAFVIIAKPGILYDAIQTQQLHAYINNLLFYFPKN